MLALERDFPAVALPPEIMARLRLQELIELFGLHDSNDEGHRGGLAAAALALAQTRVAPAMLAAERAAEWLLPDLEAAMALVVFPRDAWFGCGGV